MAVTRERFVEDQILEYLNMLPGCFAFKVQTGGYFDPRLKRFRKQSSRWIVNGTSDIIGVYNGRFFAFECKSEKGRPTEDQLAFIEKVKANGGIAGVVRSIEDVKGYLFTNV